MRMENSVCELNLVLLSSYFIVFKIGIYSIFVFNSVQVNVVPINLVRLCDTKIFISYFLFRVLKSQAVRMCIFAPPTSLSFLVTKKIVIQPMSLCPACHKGDNEVNNKPVKAFRLMDVQTCCSLIL